MVPNHEELIGAIRDAIAPMWRDTQDRISNLRDSLPQDIRQSEDRMGLRLGGVEGRLQHIERRLNEVEERMKRVEGRLNDLTTSVQRLWERQPVVLDFERFRRLEERLARLEERLGS